MKRKTLFTILLLVFAAILLSNIVYAQTFWDSLLIPFEGFPRAYARAGHFIDGIIAFVIFYGLISFTLGKAMKVGYGGKKPTMLFVGISLVLSVGLALYEHQTGFSLASFGFIAMLIIVAFIVFVIYQGLVATEAVHKTTAAALSYAAFFLVSASYGIIGEISKKFGPSWAGVLTLLFGIILFSLCLKGLGGLNRLFKEGKGPEIGGPGSWFRKIFPGKPPEGGGDEKGKGDVTRAGKRAYTLTKRAEKQAMVEADELKTTIETIEAKEKEVVDAGDEYADKKDKGKELLEEIKSKVKDLLRKGGREDNFAVRAKKYVEVLQKDLEAIGDEHEAKVVGEDTRVALGYALEMEKKLKEIEENLIGGADGLEAAYMEFEQGDTNADFLAKVAPIIKELKDIQTHMAAIIKLDEDILNIVIQEEAKAKAAE